MFAYLGLVSFLAISLGLYLFVPRDKIRDYLTFGFLAGPVLGFILLYFMIVYYGFWNFGSLDFLYFSDIPLFLTLVWLPLEIGFAYYFLNSNNSLMYLAVILFLPVLSTLSHLVMQQFGLLTYHSWSLLGTFLQSLAIHLALSAYLYYIVRNKMDL